MELLAPLPDANLYLGDSCKARLIGAPGETPRVREVVLRKRTFFMQKLDWFLVDLRRAVRRAQAALRVLYALGYPKGEALLQEQVQALPECDGGCSAG